MPDLTLFHTRSRVVSLILLVNPGYAPSERGRDFPQHRYLSRVLHRRFWKSRKWAFDLRPPLPQLVNVLTEKDLVAAEFGQIATLAVVREVEIRGWPSGH